VTIINNLSICKWFHIDIFASCENFRMNSFKSFITIESNQKSFLIARSHIRKIKLERYAQFQVKNAYHQKFQVISIVRMFAMVQFMIPGVNHFFLKHLPLFTKRLLLEVCTTLTINLLKRKKKHKLSRIKS